MSLVELCHLGENGFDLHFIHCGLQSAADAGFLCVFAGWPGTSSGAWPVVIQVASFHVPRAGIGLAPCIEVLFDFRVTLTKKKRALQRNMNSKDLHNRSLAKDPIC